MKELDWRVTIEERGQGWLHAEVATADGTQIASTTAPPATEGATFDIYGALALYVFGLAIAASKDDA